MARHSLFRSARALLIHACLFASSAPIIAQNTQVETASDELIKSYSRPIPGVDWDQLSPHFVQMLDHMFERNGWTDESDQYVRKVASRIAAIPPWNLAERFEAFTEEVSDRYGLTPQQAATFQRSIMRESAALLIKHGPTIWKQAQEALQGRAQGKPYTAEQIARWVKDADPILDEIESSVERVADELEQLLPVEKKSVLKKDMAGFQKRQEAVETMSQRWANGLWKPDEWGLENDPVQAGVARAASETQQSGAAQLPRAARLPPPAIVATKIPDHWVEHDPSTWTALVVEISKKYCLDAGQMNTAWSIHAELVERADQFSKQRASLLEAVPFAQRPTHELFQPIRELFGELRVRLESLLTNAQREAIQP